MEEEGEVVEVVEAVRRDRMVEETATVTCYPSLPSTRRHGEVRRRETLIKVHAWCFYLLTLLTMASAATLTTNAEEGGFFGRSHFAPPDAQHSFGQLVARTVRSERRQETPTAAPFAPPVVKDSEKAIAASLAEAHVAAILKRNKEEHERHMRNEKLRKRSEADQDASIAMQSRYINERYGNTRRKLEKRRVCLRCQKNYTLQQSLGRWECRYHPSDPDQGVYRCCGRRSDEMHRGAGCTPCDHTEFADNRNGILHYRLEAMVFKLIDVYPRMRDAAVSRRRVAPGEQLPDHTDLGPVYDLVSKHDQPFADEENNRVQDLAEDRDLAERQALMVPRARVEPKGFRVTNSSLSVDDDEDESAPYITPLVDPLQQQQQSHRGLFDRLPREVYYVRTASFDAGALSRADLHLPVC